MKKWMQKTLALAMSAVLLCGSVIGASAAEDEYYNRISVDSVSVAEGYEVKFLAADDQEVTAITDQVNEVNMQVYKNAVKLQLTIKNAANQQYVVLLLSGEEEIPTATNIRYIDQKAEAVFTLYPDQMSEVGEYNVVVSSATGKATAATFTVVEPPYKLGDVDEDKQISAADANLILRAVAKLESLSNKQKMAADTDLDTQISAADANKVLRVVAKLESF